MNFIATKTKVLNRGVPPDWFLESLVYWAKNAPDALFAPRKDNPPEVDIYKAVKENLGPSGLWVDLLDRKAAGCEVLRVLAGFESSWKPQTGADASNPAEDDDETFSAGLWQISYNSRGFGPDLRGMLVAYKISNGKAFQALMKSDFNFAATYTMMLLRHTIRHNGPVRDHLINRWLSRSAAKEFATLIA